MRLVSILIAVALALPACSFGTGSSETELAKAPASAPEAAHERQGSPAPTADDPAHANRFFAAGWRYCDAVVLSGIWGDDAWDAKVRVGRKLAAGDDTGVRSAVEQARAAAREGRGRTCAFTETGYAYADAQLLAKAWGSDVSEAKGRVESKVLWGNYDLIDELITGARADTPATEQGPDARAMQAFFDSETVDYCHAKMLSGAWSSTVSQAKVILGHKVMGGYTDLLGQALGEAREHARANPASRCTWTDTGFGYTDAARIAELWDMSVSEAKTALTEKYLHGSEASARQLIAGQQPGH
jgi:hypothetical protein